MSVPLGAGPGTESASQELSISCPGLRYKLNCREARCLPLKQIDEIHSRRELARGKAGAFSESGVIGEILAELTPRNKFSIKMVKR